ncbi:MAG: molybdopterin-guanine dinucleotide biosynthesis protein B [Hyphomicrobiaceae bacterium]
MDCSGVAATFAGTPIVAVVGWKNSGKTTLATSLVAELTSRGYRVATVKHAHHGFAVDTGTTDSARHRRAGAAQVAVVADTRWALMTERPHAGKSTLFTVLAHLEPADVIVLEGFKAAAVPKIEVRRRDAADQSPLADTDPMVIAIAADHAVEGAYVPVFNLNDITSLTDFIILALELARGSGSTEDLNQPTRAPQ